MYTLEELRRGLRRPREIVMEANAVYNRLRNGCDYNPDGVDVFEEDWDSLIILDACRYDFFERRHDLPGRLERRESRGGGTVEFLRGNFRNRTLLDTVYVTANPQFHRHREELETEFHAVRNVWQDEWDETLHTVPPERMTEICEAAAEAFPDKRLLFHYNQPHTPYIGPTGRRVDVGKTPGRPDDRGYVEALRSDLFHDGVSRETFRTMYRENVDIALAHVADLLDSLEGRTVVTSDHGEMLGERAAPIPIRYYSHRIGVHVDELVEVPWLVHETGARREIREEAARAGTDVDSETVSDRLRDLGYVG